MRKTGLDGLLRLEDSVLALIIWPPELASGQLQFPYAQSVDVNAILEVPSRRGVNTE
jgi:hypothetical protein